MRSPSSCVLTLALAVAFVVMIVSQMPLSEAKNVDRAQEASTAPSAATAHPVDRTPSPASPPGSPVRASGSATSSSSPSDWAAMSMAYDPSLGAIVAVDANISLTSPNSITWSSPAVTWSYNASGWSILPLSTGPPPFSQPSLTWDGADQCLLLFGGFHLLATGGPVVDTNYTWAFANGTWTNLTPTLTNSPPPTDGVQMVYDAADGYVVLHGRTDNSTWTYAHGIWTDVTGLSAPPPDLGGNIAYDSTDGYVVYFGGSPDPMAFPAAFSNATWEFHNGTWTNITALVTGAPPPRGNAGFSDDPAVAGAALFGGMRLNFLTNSTYLNDTWAYAAHTWTRVSSSLAPAARERPLVAYDAAVAQLVAFGGAGLVPTVATNGSLVYGEADLSDTWTFANSSWSLSAPVVVSARPIVDTGTTVDLKVEGAAIDGGSTFAYLYLPMGCSSVSAAQLICVPTMAGEFHPAVEISTSIGAVAWSTTTLQVNPPPTIVTFGAASSSAVLGAPLTLDARAVNGTGPLAYLYTNLPPGCWSVNASSLVCTPSAIGAWTVTLTVTDAVGGSSSSRATVAVTSPTSEVNPPIPPSHTPRTGGIPVLSFGAGLAAAGTYLDGLFIGLCAVVAVGGWTAWRARLSLQAERLAVELERSSTERSAQDPPSEQPAMGPKG